MSTATAYNIKQLLEEQLKNEKRKLKTQPRILIVEDDLTNEPLWEHIIHLASPKAVFEWTTDADSAELCLNEAMQNNRLYDLVISDIFLSGNKSGIDLWKNFREVLKGRMILVSSLDYKQVAQYCGSLEITQPVYIKKPLNISDCIETVYSILQEK